MWKPNRVNLSVSATPWQQGWMPRWIPMTGLTLLLSLSETAPSEKTKSSAKKVPCFTALLCLSIPRTVACQVPLSMGFSRQEHWSEYPFSSPGDLPNPGIEPGSPASQADSLPSEPSGKSIYFITYCKGEVKDKVKFPVWIFIVR